MNHNFNILNTDPYPFQNNYVLKVIKVDCSMCTRKWHKNSWYTKFKQWLSGNAIVKGFYTYDYELLAELDPMPRRGHILSWGDDQLIVMALGRLSLLKNTIPIKKQLDMSVSECYVIASAYCER